MKRFTLHTVLGRSLMLLLSLVMAMPADAQSKVFKDAAAVEGVTAVYISPSLLKLGADVGRLGYGVDDAVSELSGLEVISTEYDETRHRKVRELGNKVIETLGLELVIDVSEEIGKARLYANLTGDGAMADRIVLELDKEFTSYTLIYVSGKIDISRLMKDNLSIR